MTSTVTSTAATGILARDTTPTEGSPPRDGSAVTSAATRVATPADSRPASPLLVDLCDDLPLNVTVSMPVNVPQRGLGLADILGSKRQARAQAQIQPPPAVKRTLARVTAVPLPGMGKDGVGSEAVGAETAEDDETEKNDKPASEDPMPRLCGEDSDNVGDCDADDVLKVEKTPGLDSVVLEKLEGMPVLVTIDPEGGGALDVSVLPSTGHDSNLILPSGGTDGAAGGAVEDTVDGYKDGDADAPDPAMPELAMEASEEVGSSDDHALPVLEPGVDTSTLCADLSMSDADDTSGGPEKLNMPLSPIDGSAVDSTPPRRRISRIVSNATGKKTSVMSNSSSSNVVKSTSSPVIRESSEAETKNSASLATKARADAATDGPKDFSRYPDKNRTERFSKETKVDSVEADQECRDESRASSHTAAEDIPVSPGGLGAVRSHLSDDSETEESPGPPVSMPLFGSPALTGSPGSRESSPDRPCATAGRSEESERSKRTARSLFVSPEGKRGGVKKALASVFDSPEKEKDSTPEATMPVSPSPEKSVVSNVSTSSSTSTSTSALSSRCGSDIQPTSTASIFDSPEKQNMPVLPISASTPAKTVSAPQAPPLAHSAVVVCPSPLPTSETTPRDNSANVGAPEIQDGNRSQLDTGPDPIFQTPGPVCDDPAPEQQRRRHRRRKRKERRTPEWERRLSQPAEGQSVLDLLRNMTQLGDVLEPLSGVGTTMTAMPLSPLFRQTEEAAEETADAAHEVLDTDRTRGLSEGVKGTERVDFTGDEHVKVPFERMPVTETIEDGEQTKSLQEEESDTQPLPDHLVEPQARPEKGSATSDTREIGASSGTRRPFLHLDSSGFEVSENAGAGEKPPPVAVLSPLAVTATPAAGVTAVLLRTGSEGESCAEEKEVRKEDVEGVTECMELEETSRERADVLGSEKSVQEVAEVSVEGMESGGISQEVLEVEEEDVEPRELSQEEVHEEVTETMKSTETAKSTETLQGTSVSMAESAKEPGVKATLNPEAVMDAEVIREKSTGAVTVSRSVDSPEMNSIDSVVEGRETAEVDETIDTIPVAGVSGETEPEPIGQRLPRTAPDVAAGENDIAEDDEHRAAEEDAEGSSVGHQPGNGGPDLSSDGKEGASAGETDEPVTSVVAGRAKSDNIDANKGVANSRCIDESQTEVPTAAATRTRNKPERSSVASGRPEVSPLSLEADGSATDQKQQPKTSSEATTGKECTTRPKRTRKSSGKKAKKQTEFASSRAKPESACGLRKKTKPRMRAGRPRANDAQPAARSTPEEIVLDFELTFAPVSAVSSTSAVDTSAARSLATGTLTTTSTASMLSTVGPHVTSVRESHRFEGAQGTTSNSTSPSPSATPALPITANLSCSAVMGDPPTVSTIPLNTADPSLAPLSLQPPPRTATATAGATPSPECSAQLQQPMVIPATSCTPMMIVTAAPAPLVKASGTASPAGVAVSETVAPLVTTEAAVMAAVTTETETESITTTSAFTTPPSSAAHSPTPVSGTAATVASSMMPPKPITIPAGMNIMPSAFTTTMPNENSLPAPMEVKTSKCASTISDVSASPAIPASTPASISSSPAKAPVSVISPDPSAASVTLSSSVPASTAAATTLTSASYSPVLVPATPGRVSAVAPVPATPVPTTPVPTTPVPTTPVPTTPVPTTPVPTTPAVPATPAPVPATPVSAPQSAPVPATSSARFSTPAVGCRFDWSRRLRKLRAQSATPTRRRWRLRLLRRGPLRRAARLPGSLSLLAGVSAVNFADREPRERLMSPEWLRRHDIVVEREWRKIAAQEAAETQFAAKVERRTSVSLATVASATVASSLASHAVRRQSLERRADEVASDKGKLMDSGVSTSESFPHQAQTDLIKPSTTGASASSHEMVDLTRQSVVATERNADSGGGIGRSDGPKNTEVTNHLPPRQTEAPETSSSVSKNITGSTDKRKESSMTNETVPAQYQGQLSVQRAPLSGIDPTSSEVPENVSSESDSQSPNSSPTSSSITTYRPSTAATPKASMKENQPGTLTETLTTDNTLEVPELEDCNSDVMGVKSVAPVAAGVQESSESSDLEWNPLRRRRITRGRVARRLSSASSDGAESEEESEDLMRGSAKKRRKRMAKGSKKARSQASRMTREKMTAKMRETSMDVITNTTRDETARTTRRSRRKWNETPEKKSAATKYDAQEAQADEVVEEAEVEVTEIQSASPRTIQFRSESPTTLHGFSQASLKSHDASPSLRRFTQRAAYVLSRMEEDGRKLMEDSTRAAATTTDCQSDTGGSTVAQTWAGPTPGASAKSAVKKRNSEPVEPRRKTVPQTQSSTSKKVTAEKHRNSAEEDVEEAKAGINKTSFTSPRHLRRLARRGDATVSTSPRQERASRRLRMRQSPKDMSLAKWSPVLRRRKTMADETTEEEQGLSTPPRRRRMPARQDGVEEGTGMRTRRTGRSLLQRGVRTSECDSESDQPDITTSPTQGQSPAQRNSSEASVSDVGEATSPGKQLRSVSRASGSVPKEMSPAARGVAINPLSRSASTKPASPALTTQNQPQQAPPSTESVINPTRLSLVSSSGVVPRFQLPMRTQPALPPPAASSRLAQPHLATSSRLAQPHLATSSRLAQPQLATSSRPAQPHLATSSRPAQPQLATSSRPALPHLATAVSTRPATLTISTPTTPSHLAVHAVGDLLRPARVLRARPTARQVSLPGSRFGVEVAGSGVSTVEVTVTESRESNEKTHLGMLGNDDDVVGCKEGENVPEDDTVSQEFGHGAEESEGGDRKLPPQSREDEDDSAGAGDCSKLDWAAEVSSESDTSEDTERPLVIEDEPGSVVRSSAEDDTEMELGHTADGSESEPVMDDPAGDCDNSGEPETSLAEEDEAVPVASESHNSGPARLAMSTSPMEDDQDGDGRAEARQTTTHRVDTAGKTKTKTTSTAKPGHRKLAELRAKNAGGQTVSGAAPSADPGSTNTATGIMKRTSSESARKEGWKKKKRRLSSTTSDDIPATDDAIRTSNDVKETGAVAKENPTPEPSTSFATRSEQKRVTNFAQMPQRKPVGQGSRLLAKLRRANSGPSAASSFSSSRSGASSRQGSTPRFGSTPRHVSSDGRDSSRFDPSRFGSRLAPKEEVKSIYRRECPPPSDLQPLGDWTSRPKESRVRSCREEEERDESLIGAYVPGPLPLTGRRPAVRSLSDTSEKKSLRVEEVTSEGKVANSTARQAGSGKLANVSAAVSISSRENPTRAAVKNTGPVKPAERLASPRVNSARPQKAAVSCTIRQPPPPPHGVLEEVADHRPPIKRPRLAHQAAETRTTVRPPAGTQSRQKTLRRHEEKEGEQLTQLPSFYQLLKTPPTPAHQSAQASAPSTATTTTAAALQTVQPPQRGMPSTMPSQMTTPHTPFGRSQTVQMPTAAAATATMGTTQMVAGAAAVLTPTSFGPRPAMNSKGEYTLIRTGVHLFGVLKAVRLLF